MTRKHWIDMRGHSWPMITTETRIRFNSALHQALRIYIHERDRFTCQYCGVHPVGILTEYDGKQAVRWTEPGLDHNLPYWEYPDNVFEIDHIIPWQDNGSNYPDNLQLLCRKCNARKKRYECIWRLNEKKGTPNDYKNWTLQWVPSDYNA